MSIPRNLKPLDENLTLKEQTHRALRKAILDMDVYAPGIDLRLDERELSESLGISRTPIREALARLDHEGLVEILPRKGVYVRRKSRAEVLEMVILWAALETMAARMCATVASDKSLLELRAFAMHHSSAAGRADLQEYSEVNIRFHMKVFELSGSALLKTTAEGLLMHMNAIRRQAMREGERAQQSVVDHMSIISALIARDAELAAQLVLEHTMRLHDHIAAVWVEGEDAQHLPRRRRTIAPVLEARRGDH